MTIRLSLRKRVRKLTANSKGFSSVIGTTFMVLVMMFLSTSVFLWTLSQNTTYNEAVRARNQEDADRYNENVVALSGNYSVNEVTDEVTVNVVLKNVGSVTVQVINLWVLDSVNRGYTNKSLNLNMKSGDVLNLVGSSWLKVTILGAKENHTFTSWFVTARGNTIPLEKELGVIIAQLAQGIGSISMTFATFRYYELPGNPPANPPPLGTDIGSPKYNFTMPSNKWIVFGVELTNLDESREDITLYEKSCIWLLSPPDSAGAIKGDTWYITRVVGNKLSSFTPQVLKYGSRTMVYFGVCYGKSIANSITAVNILLFGKRGSTDYGQNLPFVAMNVN